jgi:hypothetical protein
MARPSENWPGFAGLNPESDKYKSIKQLLSSANFEHLKERAIDSRRRHQTGLPLDIACSINLTQFAAGFNNLVLELTFSDNVHWVARIPYRIINNDTKTSMLTEIATMRIIRQRTSIPVPRIFDFDVSMDEEFGYPYILMECLSGRTLDNRLARSIPQEHLDKVAKQFANVFAELQTLTFSRIGRLYCGETADQRVELIPMKWHCSPGPLRTSLEYFYNQRQRQNKIIMALHPGDADWLTACWVLKIALALTVIEDRVHGPFPLCHLDLHYGNLLFDDEYNLTGVIDWEDAQAAPIEQLSVSLELVSFPALSEEQNRPNVEFLELVIQSVKEMESEKAKEVEKRGNKTKKRFQHLTLLSTYMASQSAELMFRQYTASPSKSLVVAKLIAKLVYGEHITWEQLRKFHGCRSFP